MADVRPFHGLRYDPARAGDLGSLIAPPYDVISPAQQQALYDAGPYNAVRLEYSQTSARDRYAEAAHLLADWEDSGVLRREERLAFYLYEQAFSRGGRSYRRRTVFARLRLEQFESGVVRPHEYTLSGPKEDRLQLLRATRTNISPVFCLYRAGTDNPVSDLTLSEGTPGLVQATDLAGSAHALAPIFNKDFQRGLHEYMASRTLYIADGHHRYETALNYRSERRAASPAWTGEEPENFVLTGLTAADNAGLLILPIHRIVHRSADAAVLERLRRYFDVEEIPGPGDYALQRALQRQAASSRAAFVASGLVSDHLCLVSLRERVAVEELMPPEHSPEWRALDVNVLQFGALDAALGIDLAEIARGDAVEFTEDAGEAVAAVRNGHAGLAFLVRATGPQDIFSVADSGDRMPQKTTYFYPKLGTGLGVIRLDA
jgi:uncharacterized protein (DUF1015 family)